MCLVENLLVSLFSHLNLNIHCNMADGDASPNQGSASEVMDIDL